MLKKKKFYEQLNCMNQSLTWIFYHKDGPITVIRSTVSTLYWIPVQYYLIVPLEFAQVHNTLDLFLMKYFLRNGITPSVADTIHAHANADTTDANTDSQQQCY